MIFCVVMTSCVTPRKTHYLQEPSKSIADYPEVYTPADYQIQKSDELDIKVTTLDPESKKIFNSNSSTTGSSSMLTTTNQKDLYTYTVYDDGTIDFPYIGAIEVAGLTTREVKQKIEEKLTEYVKDCSVDVYLVNSYFNVIFLLTGDYVTTNPMYAMANASETDLLITWLFKITTNSTTKQYYMASVIGIVVFVICAGLTLVTFSRMTKGDREEVYQ